jgi:tetratricopeptide (TPR) repeat protein
MKPPSFITPGIFRTLPNALLLTVLLINLSVSALADDGKKNLEAQAQQMTSEGRALEDKQQFKEAEEKYTAAEAIISTKDGKSGLERIQKAEAKKFRDLLAEAHGLFDAGKPADAARKLEEAKSLGLQDPALHYNLAVCYQKSGDRLKAVSEMNQTLSLLPEDDKNRGQLEQIRSAMMTGETPPQLTPEAKQRVEAFNSTLARNTTVGETEKQQNAGSAPSGPGQTAQLPCEQLKEIESSLPKSPSVLFNLAKCAEEDGRQEQALRYLNQYLASAPTALDSDDVHLRVGTLTSLTALTGDKADDVRKHFAAATRFIDDRRFDHAVDELLKAEQEQPSYPLIKWRLALLYEAMGNTTKARSYYSAYDSASAFPEATKEATAKVATLDKERSQYDAAVQEARKTLSDILVRFMGKGGQSNVPKREVRGGLITGMAFARSPEPTGSGGVSGGVSYQYAQREIEAAQKKLEEATSIFPLGPEANEMLGFVYLQGHNPAAAMRCFDIVASQHYPITFYAKSYSARDKKAVKETKVELLPDKVHLVYLSSYNSKTKSNDPPVKPVGTDNLGNFVISDSEPAISDGDLAAFSTSELKGIETKENAVELNPGKDEIYLEPVSLTSDVPIQGVPARKFANNYSRLFIRYMGFDNTKLGKESMTGGEKFNLGMSFAAAGMSGYSAIASGGFLMASTTQMMLAMYALNSAMSTLQENRGEQRQLLEGNQFKLIPSQSFELAFKDKFE